MITLQTIKNLKRRPPPAVVFLLWRLHFHRVLFRLIARIILDHNKEKVSSGKNTSAILAIEKLIFSDDVAALERHGSKYLFLNYPTFLRLMLLRVMWPEEMREQGAFYPKRGAHRKLLLRLSGVFGDVIDELERRAPLHVVALLTGNIDYSHDYPWIGALRARGRKFIVLQKESLIYSPLYRETRREVFERDQFVFEGDAVLFYNRTAKETYIETGPVAPEQAIVTGCPRVDDLLNETLDAGSGAFILVATFMDPLYKAGGLWHEVVTAIASDSLLREHVLFKCKHPLEVAMLRKEFPGIRAVCGPMLGYLKKHPSLFVCFNSTTGLEAMILGIPVMVPWWQDGSNLGAFALFGEHTQDFHFLARSREMFVRILKERVNDGQNVGKGAAWRRNQTMRDFIEARYSFLDGKNCTRTLAAIDDIVSGAPPG